jgi:hypothetical protein
MASYRLCSSIIHGYGFGNSNLYPPQSFKMNMNTNKFQNDLSYEMDAGCWMLDAVGNKYKMKPVWQLS